MRGSRIADSALFLSNLSFPERGRSFRSFPSAWQSSTTTSTLLLLLLLLFSLGGVVPRVVCVMLTCIIFTERFKNHTLCQKRMIFEPFRYFRLYRREERRIRPSNQRGRLVRCIRRSCSIMILLPCHVSNKSAEKKSRDLFF